MVLTENEIKKIVKKGVQQLLKESKLAKLILDNEDVLDKLSQEYASLSRSSLSRPQIKSELTYYLEQNCGVCQSPDSIKRSLEEIWDKIQMGAKKYGYNGPISTPTTEEGLPSYLQKAADRLVADEERMKWLGVGYYFAKKHGNLAWELSPKNEYGMVNSLIRYPEYRELVGTLTFGEA